MKLLVVALVLSIFIFVNYSRENKKPNPIEYTSVDVIKLCPPSLQVYYRTIQYTEKYDIKYYIGFGIARQETGYKHPFQWTYKQNQTSSAKAYGTFQILLSTARWFRNDYSITKEDLLHDIELSADIGLEYVRNRYDRYGDWKYALGYYNTGYKRVNDYALAIYNNNH